MAHEGTWYCHFATVPPRSCLGAAGVTRSRAGALLEERKAVAVAKVARHEQLACAALGDPAPTARAAISGAQYPGRH